MRLADSWYLTSIGYHKTSAIVGRIKRKNYLISFFNCLCYTLLPTFPFNPTSFTPVLFFALRTRATSTSDSLRAFLINTVLENEVKLLELGYKLRISRCPNFCASGRDYRFLTRKLYLEHNKYDGNSHRIPLVQTIVSLAWKFLCRTSKGALISLTEVLCFLCFCKQSRWFWLKIGPGCFLLYPCQFVIRCPRNTECHIVSRSVSVIKWMVNI